MENSRLRTGDDKMKAFQKQNSDGNDHETIRHTAYVFDERSVCEVLKYDRLSESTEAWEVLSVPSASGQGDEDVSLITVSQFNMPPKPRKEGSMERLLIDAQHESLQSSARQSLHQSKHSSPVFPDSPAESGDYFLGYDDFNRRMLLSPSAADGSTDWFWDWNHAIGMGSSRMESRKQFCRVPRKLSSVKRKFLGLILLTNVLALLLGAGLGYYLGKKIIAGQDLEHNEWDIIAQAETRMFKFN